MYKDPTEFRERFAKWKAGEKPYKNGRISDEEYVRVMEKVAADNWQKWGEDSEDAALTRILNDNTYDYRGYYSKYPNSAANADTHWSDEFKTVWHPTFSQESIYSGKKSQFNPYGYPGGTWQGEFFNPQWYQQNPHSPGFYKDGYLKLPKFATGTEGYKYTQAGKDFDEWWRITDDKMSKEFQDVVVRPKSRGGNTTEGNWRRQWSLKGEPGLKLVSPEFELLAIGKMFGVPNHIGNWYPKVPNDPNRYYRIVGRGDIDPITDAMQSGVIRGPGKVPGYREAVDNLGDNAIIDLNTKGPRLLIKAHDYPMFAKGAPWKGSTSNVTKGKPTIIRSKQNTGDIVWEESNVHFRHKGHSGIFRPTLNGDPNAAPSKYFEYFEPSKWFGYNRYDIMPQ